MRKTIAEAKQEYSLENDKLKCIEDTVQPSIQPVVQTKCRDCIFAIYKSEGTWPSPATQIGCSCNRLENFKQQNITTVETEEYRTYYTLNDRVCNMFSKEVKSGETIQQAQKRIRDYITIKPSVIIPFDNTLEELEQTIESLNKQSYLPSSVTVIDFKEINPNKIKNILEKTELSYFIKYMLKDPENYGYYIDDAVGNFSNMYYGIIYSGRTIPPTTLYNLDKKINDDLERYVYLKATNECPISIVLRHIHKYLGGNEPMDMRVFCNIDTECVIDSLEEKLNFLEDNTSLLDGLVEKTTVLL